MKLASIGVRNVWRNRFRTILTILGVGVAILAFVFLRTVLSAWTAASEHAATDRIVTRDKVSFIIPLPQKYLQEIANQPGVEMVAGGNWFGGKDPKHENEFFATIAVNPETYLKVYNEVTVPKDQIAAWEQDRQGALVGDALAKKLGWKVGDRVTLRGTIFPGDWQFTIRGIYSATRQSVDRSTFLFHYNYLNEWLKKNRPRAADKVGWVTSRISPDRRPADVAKQIDKYFEDRDIQTLSADEHTFNTSFLGMLDAVLNALDVVSVVILLIMALILGNTIAMGVRERTHEYGVLRAIGFMPKHLVLFVLGEAATTGFIGGVVGLLMAYPIVERGLGRFLEENMGSWFPFFRIDPMTSVVALILAVLLAVVAAIIPAYQASKLEVVTSLRKVG